MAKGSKSHTHRYHKIEIAGNMLFACALGNCTHYMPKHLENLLVGKDSHCWNCDKVFQLGFENLKQEKPTCPTCHLGLPSEESLDDLIASIASEKEKTT